MADVHTAQERAKTLADPTSFAAVPDPATRKVLTSYLSSGWLPVIPRTGVKRSLLLDHLVAAFEPGVRYSEPAINDIVRAWNPDVAALRRYLVEEGLMARGHGEYWRCGGSV